jgi:hypothetical protein
MNALRFLPRRTYLGLLLVILAAHAISAGEAAGPAPAKRPADKKDRGEQRIFRLKYIPANEAAQILRELFGRRTEISIAIDDRTNSLVVSGSKSNLDELEAITSKIDVEGSGKAGDLPQLKVFPLAQVGIEPDAGLETMLKMLIPAGRSGKFTLEARRKVLVVYADPPSIERVAMLLTTLQMERGTKPAAMTSSEIQVRLFWLVSGAGRRTGAELPDNLKDLAGELSKLGMVHPRLATQVTIATETGTRFETSAAVALAGRHDLSVSGTATDRKDCIGVSLTIAVSQSAPRRSSRREASLRTQVSVPFNRPVLLGVIPGETTTSAFVVEVTQKKATGLTGFQFDEAPWRIVLRWLADRTGKEVIGFRPTGTFTFKANPNRDYTIGEVIDVLNETLSSSRQPYLLIHRKQNIVIVPADEKVDAALVPRLSVDELSARGKSEIVSVVISLGSLKAREVATDVRKLLGPFGDATALDMGNRLVLQDCAGNVRRICDVLAEIQVGLKR